MTTHLHLVPRLRMSGAIPILPLCALSAFAGMILSFFFFVTGNKAGSIANIVLREKL